MTHPLRILHRSYAGDNAKPRQPYYSKVLALASVIRAAQEAPTGAELVFINDGPMVPERLSIMERWGEVRAVRRGGSDQASYREMLTDERDRGGLATEVVWLAEDDYLYVPTALRHLVEGAAAQPGIGYFSMYGSRAIDRRSTRKRVVHPEPGSEGKGRGGVNGAVEVGDIAWFHATGTASTFGIRRSVLEEDVALLAVFARTGGAWDRATCRALQGFAPFTGAELRADLFPMGSQPPARRAKSMARGAVRVASLPFVRRSNRRVLMGSDPELVLHMEARNAESHPTTARTAARVDWPAIAAETTEWARDHGITVPAPADR